MRVIEHGKFYGEIIFKCSYCGCKYIAYKKECKEEYLSNEFGQEVTKFIHSCPECSTINYIFEEGGTE